MTRHLIFLTMLTLAAFVAAAAMSCTSAHAGMFVSPIGGTPYADWTIVNYVDLDKGSGVLDYHGGNYTYNGHNAIDYTLPNFAAMDAGVSVNAAAAGTVTAVHDGEFDRWSRVNPNPGDPANSVVIDHGNGIVSEYLHLKKNSIVIGVGDTVVAGQQIGEVGSSGNSSDAHLHFAVYENGNVVETYQDPSRWWINPVPYAGDVSGALDYGVTNHTPTLTELVDRPVDYDVFRRFDGAGQVAVLWANLHGFDAGDDIDAYFYRPNGTEYAHWNWTTGQIRYGWWNAAIGLPNRPALGTWQIDFQRNGSTIITDSFRVVVPEPINLDIKPGPSNNTVALNGNGTLQMAILASADFNVSEVDIASLLFGDPILVDGGATPLGATSDKLRDLNHDGLDDLLVVFSISDLVAGGALDASSVEGQLTGELFDGTPIFGSDIVRMVPQNNGGGGSLAIATVPEPGSCVLALAALCLVMGRWRIATR